MAASFGESWLELFPTRLRVALTELPTEVRHRWQEVRLRAGQPILILSAAEEIWLPLPGGTPLSAEDLQATFQMMTQNSLYALEEELRRGFITLPGGHRLGFVGHAVLKGGRIRLLRQISSLNLRLARAVEGVAEPLLPLLVSGGRLLSTLIISPPRGGKTTLLRDLVRAASQGRSGLGLPGRQVGLVDERSEVAGTYLGRPQLDVGPRTDVLDGAPKSEGMLLMLRAMSPDVLATDELGDAADAVAVAEAAKAGVAVLATAHAGSLEEARRRPVLAQLLAAGYFQRLILLDASRGPGTVKAVYRFAPAREGGDGECSGSWVPCSSWSARAASAT
ncbi:MAG: stage III sporulation protein AA [Bacillota bacterium]